MVTCGAEFSELVRRDPEHRYAHQSLFRGAEAAYLSGDHQTAWVN